MRDSSMEKLLNQYRIIEPLGKPDQSQTFLARDEHLPDAPLCVIKHCSWCSVSPSIDALRQQFSFETERLYHLSQQVDRVPKLLASFEQAQQFYLVQEYISGPSLQTAVEEGMTFSPESVAHLLLDVLMILKIVHLLGIVHQDVKPANLIYRRDRRWALVGFNVLHNPHCDPAASSLRPVAVDDLEALGKIACDLLLHSVGTVNAQHDSVDALSHADIPPALATVVQRLLQRRYQLAESVISDLNRFVHGSARFPLPRSIVKQATDFFDSRSLIGSVALVVASLVGINFSNVFRSSPMVQELSTLTRMQNVAQVSELKAVAVTKNQIEVTDLDRDRLISALRLNHLPDAVSVSANGLLAVAERGNLRVFHLDEENTLETLESQFVSSALITALAFSPDSQRLSIGTQDGMVLIWDLVNHRVLHRLPLRSSAPITALAYGSHDVVASASSDRRVQVWHAETGQLQYTFAGHTEAISSLLLSPDSTSLYSSGDDRTLVWSLNTGALTHALPSASGKVSTSFLMPMQQTPHLVTLHQDRTIRCWTLSPSSFELTRVFSPGNFHLTLFGWHE